MCDVMWAVCSARCEQPVRSGFSGGGGGSAGTPRHFGRALSHLSSDVCKLICRVHLQPNSARGMVVCVVVCCALLCCVVLWCAVLCRVSFFVVSYSETCVFSVVSGSALFFCTHLRTSNFPPFVWCWPISIVAICLLTRAFPRIKSNANS
jgi:hypothetical protein